MTRKEKIDAVIVLACLETGIYPDMILNSTQRGRLISNARMIIAYILRYRLEMKLWEIGVQINKNEGALSSCLERMNDLLFIKDKITQQTQNVERKFLRLLNKYNHEDQNKKENTNTEAAGEQIYARVHQTNSDQGHSLGETTDGETKYHWLRRE